MAASSPAHIKPGVITALVLIAITLFFYFTGLKTGNALQMALRILVVAAGVAAACYTFAKPDPELTGREIFFFGFRVTAIITLLTIAFGVLFIFAVPQFKEDAIIAFQKDQLTANDGLPVNPLKADEDVATYKKRFLTLFIGMNMMIVVLSGLVGSLIGTLIRPKTQ
jgi:hypothetical protein